MRKVCTGQCDLCSFFKVIIRCCRNCGICKYSERQYQLLSCLRSVALYKKLLSLTGKAPLDFIKTIRMKRAAQLLEKTQMTVSEIAYEVGFSNPKYFTKYFKKEFNQLPSEYLALKRKKL
ncbi:MAG: helix-turn-helix transcriptional regulator [Bacteroidetes bacterium]|nr:helix-turn-helix transcriptional regulator [Bacteroidota bacterium]